MSCTRDQHRYLCWNTSRLETDLRATQVHDRSMDLGVGSIGKDMEYHHVSLHSLLAEPDRGNAKLEMRNQPISSAWPTPHSTTTHIALDCRCPMCILTLTFKSTTMASCRVGSPICSFSPPLPNHSSLLIIHSLYGQWKYFAISIWHFGAQSRTNSSSKGKSKKKKKRKRLLSWCIFLYSGYMWQLQ